MKIPATFLVLALVLGGELTPAIRNGTLQAQERTETSQETAAPRVGSNARAQGQEHAAGHTKALRSDMLTLTVDGRSVQLSPADLRRLPQTEISVLNGHSKQQERYRGVTVSDLLMSMGITPDPAHRQQILHSYLRAQGTDFYFVLYSATELQAAMHSGTALVALEQDGKPLGQDGQFKLIETDDKLPARWVRNLASLTFVTIF